TLLVAPVTRFPFASEIATEVENGALAGDEVGWVTNDRTADGPGTTLNAELVAPVTPVAAALRLYPVPALVMDRSENVATPPSALPVLAPPSPAVPALPSVSATAPVNPVAVLPSASRAVTTTAGAIVAPATVLLRCVVKVSELAAAAV